MHELHSFTSLQDAAGRTPVAWAFNERTRSHLQERTGPSGGRATRTYPPAHPDSAVPTHHEHPHVHAPSLPAAAVGVGGFIFGASAHANGPSAAQENANEGEKGPGTRLGPAGRVALRVLAQSQAPGANGAAGCLERIVEEESAPLSRRLAFGSPVKDDRQGRGREGNAAPSRTAPGPGPHLQRIDGNVPGQEAPRPAAAAAALSPPLPLPHFLQAARSPPHAAARPPPSPKKTVGGPSGAPPPPLQHVTKLIASVRTRLDEISAARGLSGGDGAGVGGRQTQTHKEAHVAPAPVAPGRFSRRRAVLASEMALMDELEALERSLDSVKELRWELAELLQRAERVLEG